MIFLQVLISIFTQIGGFQSNIKDIKENSREIFHVSAGKTSTFVRADTSNRRKQICLCGNHFRGTTIFVFPVVERRKKIDIKVLSNFVWGLF